jgi:hypothetical protein
MNKKQRYEIMRDVQARCRKENDDARPHMQDLKVVGVDRWTAYKDKARALHGKPFHLGTHLGAQVFLGKQVGGYVVEGYLFRGRGSNKATFDTEPACCLSIKTIDRAHLLTDEELAETVVFKDGLMEAIKLRTQSESWSR